MFRPVDVIVAGAGPVGFLTALGLARKGIEVRVLEAEAAIGDAPRASMYFPTTVRILDGLGLLEEALAIGLATADFCYHVPEFGTRIHVDTKVGLPADEPYPYNLAFGQHILAQLVMGRAALAERRGFVQSPHRWARTRFLGRHRHR